MMELEESGFSIIPELSREEIELIDAKIQEIGSGGWVKKPCCIHDYDSSWFDLFLWRVIAASAVYLLVLLVYYIFYKIKKTKNPLIFSFRRTRLLWVILLIVPVISFVIVRILL